MSTEDILRELIVNDLGWTGSAAELTNDFDLIENEVIDSLGIMKLVGLVEGRFDIEIPDEEFLAENFSSVGALAALITPLISS